MLPGSWTLNVLRARVFPVVAGCRRVRAGSCESLGLATRPARQREAVQLAAWPEAPVVLPAGAPGAPAEAQVMALVDQQPLVFQLPGGLPSLERYTGGTCLPPCGRLRVQA